MKWDKHRVNHSLRKLHHTIGSYFKIMSPIILIGMLFTVLFSLFFVGINKGDDKINFNKINKFKDTPESIVKDNGKDEKVKVYISSQNKIVELNLEEYVLGVVSGEMPANFNIEALKAQSVAARTYAVAHIKKFGGTPCKRGKGADLCDTVHCQVYKTKESRLNSWPKKDREELWKKLVQAVSDTSGEVLTYNNKLVFQPYYFSTSSGNTENCSEVFSSDVPYLKSVSSPGEEIARKFKSSKKFDYSVFVNSINNAFPKANISLKKVKDQIKILDRTQAGSVKKIKVGNTNITGPEFRRALNLNSANFNINFLKDCVEVDCKGYGHGVGMSQWGANVMANNKKKYKEILMHYYQNTEVKNLSSIKVP